MIKRLFLLITVLFVSFSLMLTGCGKQQAKQPTSTNNAANNAKKVTLTLYGAGTLANPFKQVDQAFEKKYPNVTINAQFGGSVKMVKQVTELKQPADIVAVADYSVIPQLMFGKDNKPKFADWYAGFATNGITFVYTDKSKGADKINADNWYQILAQPGVQIGRSNPDTDPSGYQTLQMLDLAEKYYKQPGLAQSILKNAPKTNIRDTETELISALQTGQIDYLAIYTSDAKQHGFKYLDLPPEINLSDAKYAGQYQQASVTTKNGSVTGKPIVYAVTIPTVTKNADWATKYLAFLLGPDGQSIMKQNGFGQLVKPYAFNQSQMPQELKSLTTPWPQS